MTTNGWLLTGEMVFSSDSPVKMIVDHARTPPVPPSQRTATPVPADLEAVILACLEKDPAQRPQSAGALADRLFSCSPTGWTAAEARSWWRLYLPVSDSSPKPAAEPPSVAPTS